MGRNTVQAGKVMADLAVSDQLGIVRIIGWIIGIIGVTFPALGRHIPFETHVVGVRIVQNVCSVFMVTVGHANLTIIIAMMIGGGVTSLTWGARVWIEAQGSRYYRLIPVAVFAGKGRGRHYGGWIFVKT
jgi:hypothetical protein